MSYKPPYKIFIKNVNPNKTNIILSNLSKTPPCPGIIFEKSLIPKNLFIAENAKSPHCPNKDRNVHKIISDKSGILASMQVE